MDVAAYLSEIRALYKSGQATEHSYRPALARLFNGIDDDVEVINEPQRLVDVGAPDFVFNRKGVALGWCEAKDIGKDIQKFKAGDYSKEQKQRYTKGLPNLIYTNGTDFEFIVKGEVTGFVSIADLIPTLPARPENFVVLEHRLKDFASQTPISIGTAKNLAEMMAGKAAIVKDIMGRALVQDMEAGLSTELTDQYDGFKESLIHDISAAEFADIYAETIAYGLFAARLHDDSLSSFSRTEALELLPKSNPFLRNLFVYIAGPNLDDRLRWIIDELCDVFRATDLHEILKDFGKFTARNDPFLHFYETFLSEYNPKKRKARGVWYTPEPVVNFIVRAVDDVLKTEFGLADGLADTSKITIPWDSGQNDKHGEPVMTTKDVHRVQILDPATGTGTFLAEVIKLVSERVKDVAPGQWSSYVENNLIPRIHGFELLMASYAMCHMKLDMILTELGYKPSGTPPRLGVYLTNSLEEGERVEQTLPFARWISEEAKGANTIKRDTPIMCVIGNPPYSVSSSNNSAFIEGLMGAYKTGLNEQNIQPLSDDYIKFIRFAEHLVAKNGEGVLAFVTNSSYIDGRIHRRMRQQLMETFDKIFVLDLHGSTKKLEVAPDGTADKNVFDIMQGVAIIIAVKSSQQRSIPCEIRHADLYGSRDSKNAVLFELRISSPELARVHPIEPYHLFVPINNENIDIYQAGFPLDHFLREFACGMVTARDGFLVQIDESGAVKLLSDLHSLPEQDFRYKYNENADSRDWTLKNAKADAENAKVSKVLYRPFDTRFLPYSKNSKGVLSYPRDNIMRQFRQQENLALLVCKQQSTFDFQHALVSKLITDKCTISSQTKEASYQFPLYLYPEEGTLESERRVNFDPKIYVEIRERAGLSGADGDELKVFDYIYGVLHSPDYRRAYKEFLKIDFPRIPYPASPEIFAAVSEKGEALRRLHLMEDAAIGDTPYRFEGSPVSGGDSMVVKPVFTGGKVHINADQYFADVPQVAWDFYIGGYQPAQKWLKDRKGRTLTFDDIRHYQKIIKILFETDRIMQTIDMPPSD